MRRGKTYKVKKEERGRERKQKVRTVKGKMEREVFCKVQCKRERLVRKERGDKEIKWVLWFKG